MTPSAGQILSPGPSPTRRGGRPFLTPLSVRQGPLARRAHGQPLLRIEGGRGEVHLRDGGRIGGGTEGRRT